MHKLHSSVFFLALIIYCIYILVIPEKGLMYDIECWINWTQYINQHGLGKIYDSGCNYLPGHLIEFKVFTLFFSTDEAIANNIYFLKYFTFLFDVASALLVCSLVQDAGRQKMMLLLMLFNPAFVHNTVLWGQFDSVFSCLIFASFISLFKKRFLPGFIFYLIALNFKFQAILFLPAIVLITIFQMEFRPDWKKIFKGVAYLIILQVLILTPFILASSTKLVFNNLKGLSGYYNYISLNASNIWHLMLEGDLRWTADWNKFGGISYKKWGLIMLSIALFISIFPLLKNIYSKWKKNKYDLQMDKLLIIFSLFPLAFFYFNTQMHERYSFPAFVFIAAFSLLSGKWWPYILFSAAYFLNNEKVLRSINFFNYESIAFDFQTGSIIYLILIAGLITELYWGKSKTETTALQ